MREQASDIHLFAFAKLAQDGVKADPLLHKVSLVGPLTLDEREAIADSALVADKQQTTGAFGVGVEFVSLLICQR